MVGISEVIYVELLVQSQSSRKGSSLEAVVIITPYISFMRHCFSWERTSLFLLYGYRKQMPCFLFFPITMYNTML